LALRGGVDEVTRRFHQKHPALLRAQRLELSDDLVAHLEHLKSDVADFRDKQISHETSPRTMRPLMFDGKGNVRMVLTRLYPKDGDVQVEARHIHELMAELDDYIRSIISFVQTNGRRRNLSITQPTAS
jgi:hypothetical protein